MRDPSAAKKGEAPAGRPTYDDAGWPVLIARMPPNALSDEEFEAHLEALRKPYLRGEPFGIMIVRGGHPPLSATQRKAAADALKSDNQRFHGLLRAQAVVVRSPRERGIVTAVAWMAQPPFPFAAFETESAARDWLLGHLGAGNL